MKLLSFDAETDGLWGTPFAVAAIVYQDGQETTRFIARLSDDAVKNSWVAENVLPTLANVAPTHETYEAMLSDFSDFYKANKADADCICHMGYIVEAHLLREMHRLGFIGDWDAPYPLYDVSGNLQAAGENATSVDGYAKKHALEIADFGTTHNPLYDCEVAAKVYMHLQSVAV
jgi:hypothetical protein